MWTGIYNRTDHGSHVGPHFKKWIHHVVEILHTDTLFFKKEQQIPIGIFPCVSPRTGTEEDNLDIRRDNTSDGFLQCFYNFFI